jgi:hypothetical protein
MRNKTFIYPLVLTLLLSIMGVSVTRHVCAMEVEDIACDACASTLPSAADDCKEDEQSCCKTIHERISMKEDATILKSHNLTSPLSSFDVVLPSVYALAIVKPTSHTTSNLVWASSPPPILEHIVLRI